MSGTLTKYCNYYYYYYKKKLNPFKFKLAMTNCNNLTALITLN
jgi:hypothetical protein